MMVRRLKKVLSLILVVMLAFGNVIFVSADSVVKGTNVNVTIKDIVAEKDAGKVYVYDFLKFSYKESNFGGYYENVVLITSEDEGVVKPEKKSGKYTGTVKLVGLGETTLTVRIDCYKNNFLFSDEKIDTVEVKIPVRVVFTSAHLDIDQQGKYTEDIKIDGVSQPGYPKSYDIDIIKATGSINGGASFNFGSNNAYNDKDEFRINKQMTNFDSISITIEYKKGHYETVKVGKKKVEQFVDDFNGKVFTYTKSFADEELMKANENCESGLGFDFAFDFADISNQETNKVIVHYYKTGTTEKLFNSVEVKALPGTEIEVNVPSVNTETNGIVPGHYQVTSTAGTIDNGKLDVTVGNEDSEVIVYYSPEGKYNVIFLDSNGEPIKADSVYVGEAVSKPATDPAKADDKLEGDKETGKAASWTKYTFDKWIPAEEGYTLADINNVTRDMTFKPAYISKEVNVMFYILKAGYEQPSELQSYPAKNYSEGVAGKLYSFTEVANDDVAVLANLAEIPSLDQFEILDKDGNPYELKDDQTIKWYVVKEEGNGWHVDGIITNQKYKLTVNHIIYVDGKKVVLGNDVMAKAAGENYTVTSKDIEGYQLIESQASSISDKMPYEDVEVDFIYEKKTYSFIVDYELADGSVAIDGFKLPVSVRKVLTMGDKYKVETPALDGYNADMTVVEGVMPAGDIRVVVKYSNKTYKVVFYDEDGTIIKEEIVYETGTANKPKADPVKADKRVEGDKEAGTPASWTKYTFDKWVPGSETYSLENLESVTQNMEFTASYTEKEVAVKYFVLNVGLSQPSELSSYPAKNYSEGVAGGIYSFVKIANDDAAVLQNLANIPADSEFQIVDMDGNPYTLQPGQTIKWYVVKQHSDGWHIDGIVTNQMYNINVKYVTYDGNDKIVLEKASFQKAATDAYEVGAIDIDGYKLAEGQLTAYKGEMPYEDVDIEFVYDKKPLNLTVKYQLADGSVAIDGFVLPDTYTDVLYMDDKYQVTTPSRIGYTVSQAEVSGTMGTEDVEIIVTYTNEKYIVTVYHKYTGGHVFATETEAYIYGASYLYNAKDVTGYVASKEDVSGIVTADVSETIEYNKQKYQIKYYVDDVLYEIKEAEYGDKYDIDAVGYETPEGYEFSGWDVDGQYSMEEGIVRNLDVYGYTSEIEITTEETTTEEITTEETTTEEITTEETTTEETTTEETTTEETTTEEITTEEITTEEITTEEITTEETTTEEITTEEITTEEITTEEITTEEITTEETTAEETTTEVEFEIETRNPLDNETTAKEEEFEISTPDKPLDNVTTGDTNSSRNVLLVMIAAIGAGIITLVSKRKAK